MLVRVAIFFPSQLVRSMASGQTGQTGLPVESHVEEAKWLAEGVATILLPRGMERNVQERIRKLHLTVNLLARVSHYVVYNVITQILRQNFFFFKSSIGLFTEKKLSEKLIELTPVLSSVSFLSHFHRWEHIFWVMYIHCKVLLYFVTNFPRIPVCSYLTFLGLQT